MQRGSLENDKNPKAELGILPAMSLFAHVGVCLWPPVWLGLMHWALLYLGASDYCFKYLKACHREKELHLGQKYRKVNFSSV